MYFAFSKYVVFKYFAFQNMSFLCILTFKIRHFYVFWLSKYVIFMHFDSQNMSFLSILTFKICHFYIFWLPKYVIFKYLDSKNYHSLFWLKLELHAEPSCLQHFRDRNELRNGEGWVHLVFLLLGWHPCLITGLPYWLFPIWLPHAMEWCYAEIYKNCRFIGCPN